MHVLAQKLGGVHFAVGGGHCLFNNFRHAGDVVLRGLVRTSLRVTLWNQSLTIEHGD